MGGAAETSDEFGSVLTVGDFNGDCIDDLVVASYLEDLAGESDAGMVFPLIGRPGGLLAEPRRRVLGDVNCDGSVNSIDASLVLQQSAGLLATVSCPGEADVNGDGVIDSLDAALLLQHDAGLLPGFEPAA